MSQGQDEDIVQRLRDWAAIIDATKDRAAVVMLSGQTYVEAADEIERLREQLALAHTILGSEAMIWLVAGSHLDSAWREIVSRLVNSYWDSYGNVYRPTSST